VGGTSAGYGNWIAIKNMGRFQRVTGYQIFKLGNYWGETFDIKLFYGEELLSHENVPQVTASYSRDIVFAPAFPAPQADEIWLSVRAVKHGGTNWWMDELELFAQEWASDDVINVAQDTLGGIGLGRFILLRSLGW
jgi:hypothetical protein